MRRVLYWILVILCLCGMLGGGYMAVSQLLAYRAAGRAYEGLGAYISRAGGSASARAGDSREIREPEQPWQEGAAEGVQVDFEGLAAINSQVVGWIFGPGTVISYPVVQAADNSYYLHRMFTGEANGSGCIFLDAACTADFSGGHSIIYGHHMKNGTMFASLGEYADQAYYEAHPYFQLATPKGNWRVDIFSAYVADVGQEAWQVEIGDGKYREDWLQKVRSRSAIQTQEAPKEGERILTLSTCSYEFEDARFVVHGVLHPWEE